VVEDITMKLSMKFGKESLLTTHGGRGFKLNDYGQCVANKAINCKQCTIIWYVDDLKFKLNDYGQSVANKTINCKQCKIIWHVDDLNISHV